MENWKLEVVMKTIWSTLYSKSEYEEVMHWWNSMTKNQKTFIVDLFYAIIPEDSVISVED